jgi:GT2 family glycosyltransferase
MTSTFVVILNYNGRTHLEICLPSVIEAVGRQAQVVVVDNHSTDGSRHYVAATYPSVKLLLLDKNRGFCGGNNLGIRYALEQKAEAIALLNNDTRVDHNWLRAMLAAMEENEKAAICDSQQRNWEGEYQHRFRYVPEWAEAISTRLPNESASPPVTTTFASGCCMLIRSAVIHELGAFDERYFMYVEDVDLSLRVQIAGYKILHVPSSIVFHRVSGSSTESPQRMGLGYRNQLWTLLKNYQFSTLVRYREAILKRWVLTKNRIALRATAHVFLTLASTLRARHATQRLRRVPDHAFLLD